jgi:hypothetical protein
MGRLSVKFAASSGINKAYLAHHIVTSLTRGLAISCLRSLVSRNADGAQNGVLLNRRFQRLVAVRLCSYFSQFEVDNTVRQTEVTIVVRGDQNRLTALLQLWNELRIEELPEDRILFRRPFIKNVN